MKKIYQISERDWTLWTTTSHLGVWHQTRITQVRSCSGSYELWEEFSYLPVSTDTKSSPRAASCSFLSLRQFDSWVSLCWQGGDCLPFICSHWNCLPIEVPADNMLCCRVHLLTLPPDRLWLVLLCLITGWMPTWQQKTGITARKLKGSFTWKLCKSIPVLLLPVLQANIPLLV